MIFDPAIINELYYSSSDAQVFHLQRHGTCWVRVNYPRAAHPAN